MRGAKVELEEAGLETDNMAESTAKLRNQLLALTDGRVDIMIDENTFMSTTEMLRSIASVYDSMTDIDRTAALELIAGKHHANTIASLLQNFEMAEGAIEAAANSSGSAIEENMRWMESLTGHVEVFKNAVQTMWMNFLETDVLKFIVDIGTALVKVIDKVGMLNILLPSLLGIFTFRNRDTLFPALQEVFGKVSNIDKVANAVTNVQNVMNSGKASIDAYAQAVRGLEAAEQAQILAEQGLTQAQIDAVLAKNNATIADKNEANASRDAAAADIEEANASKQAAAADQAEVAASNAAANADINEANGSKQAAAGDAIEAAGSKATAAGNQAAAASGLFAKLSGAFKGATGAASKFFKALGPLGAITAVITGISIVSSIINSYKQKQEEARQATIDAGMAYSQTSESIESYKSQIATLKDSLASGNLSEQEAYDARKQLLSIQGEMTSAFGQEAASIDILRDSITECNAALDEMSAKQAQTNLAENADQVQKAVAEMEKERDWMQNVGSLGWYNENPEVAKRIEAIVGQYENASISYTDKGDGKKFMTLHINANAEDAKETMVGLSTDFAKLESEMDIDINEALGMEGAQSWSSRFQTDLKEVNAVLDDWKEIYDNSTLWEIAANDDYSNMINQLNDAKSQINEAIASGAEEDLAAAFANFDNVKLDFQTILDDPDVPQRVKDYIQEIVDGIESASKATKVELELETEFKDPDSKTKKNFDNILKGLINESGERMNVTEILNEGLQYEADVAKMDELELAGDTAGFQAIVDGMSQQELAYGRLKYAADEYGVSVEDLLNILVRLGQVDPGEGMSEQYATVTTLDQMKSGVETYVAAQQAANELLYDGQGITDDYYTALKAHLNDVTVGEYSFADAVDDTNGNVVKNAKLLRLLINQKKKEQRATINAAKSMGMLQYGRLVNDMQEAVNTMQDEYITTGQVTDATYANIDALHSQINALQNTIREYALLELQLSDAANAYSEFEAAKARDAELTYGDSMIEMLGAINEGFLTGKMGTEAFQAAVEALVPTSVYTNIDDLSDRMRAIHDYIDSDEKFADYFTIDDSGNFSVTIDNIESFIKDCQEAELFTDTGLEDFELTDNVNSLRDFSDALGITEAAALAMVTELSKYDASWSNLLRDITSTDLERTYYNAVDAAEEATTAMEEFWKAGKDPYGEDAGEYQTLCDNLNKTTEAANQSKEAMLDHAKQYVAAQELIAGVNGEAELTADRVNHLLGVLGILDSEHPEVSFEDGKLVLTQQQIDHIRQLMQETGENDPVIEMQFRYDQVLSDIETVKAYINKLKEGGTADPIVIQGVEIKNLEEAQTTLDNLTADRDALELFYSLTPSEGSDLTGIEKLEDMSVNGVTIPVKADTTELDTDLASLYAEGSATTPITVSVNVDTTDFDTDMASITTSVSTPKTISVTVTDNGTTDGVQTKVDTLEATVINNKEFDVTSGTLQTTINKVTTLQTKLNNLPTSKTITINVKQNGSIPSGDNEALGNARALGNAHATNKNVGLPNAEHNAIVGELGEELVVDAEKGIYYTVGSHGTEMVNLPKGAIIYNHKQTKELLQNGHTSRGHLTDTSLSFAKGNAHNGYGIINDWVNKDSNSTWGNGSNNNKASNSSTSAVKDNTSAVKENTKATKDAADEFSEIIDWIDVLFSRIESVIADQEAIIENKLDSISAIGDKTPNYNIIFEKYTQQLIASQKAAAKYQQLANEAMSGLSADIVDKIKNGAIDIAEYKDEATVEKINKALDYQEKALEYTRKIEETTAEIAATGKKEFDDKQQAYENAIAQVEHLNDLYQAKNELSALKYGFGANAYLKAQISGNLELLELLERERKDLKATLQSGRVPVNSQEWYDMVEAIHDVDDAIVDCETSLEDLQNEINDLHWEAFDELINRFDYIGSDIENLIQLLSRQVNELVEEDLAKLTSNNWANKEGITTLGLYAQEMERAQYVANKYAAEIKELQANKNKYNEVEYTTKLNELISAQYESIEQYYEAKDAIIELNEARVDAIEEGIQEEIDAYSELIEKKKELLDEEQKLHDFNKTVTEQAKDIAKLEKQLAAMAGDDTAATVAKRKQLEAELMEAREELEETYYDHSMEARQEALDKELADFEEEKNKEIEKWKDWLKDTEKVLDESFEYVQANTKVVYDTLTELGAQYSLTLNDSLVNPWMSGMSAIDNYSSKFSAAISSFTKELDKLAASWNKLLSSIENNASSDIIQTDKDSNLYVPTSGKYTESDFAPGDITAATVHKVQTGTTTSGTIKVGGQINAGNAKIYGGYNDTTGEKQYFSSDPVYTVLEEKNGMLKVRWHGLSSGVTGYFKKSDVKAVGGTTTPTYSYADSNNKTIEDYSKEYYAAKNSGNVQGMMAANNAANAIRKALGQALQSAGQDIANVANSTGYTGPTNKGQSNAAVYSTYKDEYGYTVDDYSKKYQAARAAGNADQMQLYNDRANAIRRKFGIAIQDSSKDIAAIRAKYQYASGVNKVKEDQIALIDELGEELVVHTDGRGRLKYLEKGSGVVPANLTERLIDFATDPASVIDSMAPSIKAPRITSQNFNINMEFGELVHVDSVSKDTLPELQKMVRTEFNSLMKEVNNGLRRAQKAK